MRFIGINVDKWSATNAISIYIMYSFALAREMVDFILDELCFWMSLYWEWMLNFSTLDLLKGSTAFRLIPELRSEALHCLDHFALDCTPVKAHLANALGGSQFLAERVVTPFDTRIDLMVAMRRGDYPIAISDNNSTNDDIFQVGLHPTRIFSSA